MAFGIEPSAPSRREIITSFHNYENEPFAAERVTIALLNRKDNRFQSVDSGDYKKLLGNIDFLTGVLEGRGAIYFSEANISEDKTSSQIYPRLYVASRNRALLEALTEKLGGHVETHQQNRSNFLKYYVLLDKPERISILEQVETRMRFAESKLHQSTRDVLRNYHTKS